VLTPEQTEDTERRLRFDMAKTLRCYGIGRRQLGPELLELLLDELVLDAMHQVDRFTDWPEESTL
jgi:hypothetical protein